MKYSVVACTTFAVCCSLSSVLADGDGDTVSSSSSSVVAENCDKFMNALLVCEKESTSCGSNLKTMEADLLEKLNGRDSRVAELEAETAILRSKSEKAEAAARDAVSAAHVSMGSLKQSLEKETSKVSELGVKLAELEKALEGAKVSERDLRLRAEAAASKEQECASNMSKVEGLYQSERAKHTTCQKEYQALQQLNEEMKKGVARMAKESSELEQMNEKLRHELSTIGTVIFNKDKAHALGSSLWTIGRALVRNLKDRVIHIVGRDTADQISEQSLKYYKQSSSVITEKSQPVVGHVTRLYSAHLGPKVVSPGVATISSLTSPHLKQGKVLLNKGTRALDNHLDKVIRRLSYIEPQIAEIMPITFEDRLYAVGFLTVCALILNYVFTQVWYFICSTLSCVIPGFRSSTSSSRKSTSHRKSSIKSSSAGQNSSNNNSKTQSKPSTTTAPTSGNKSSAVSTSVPSRKSTPTPTPPNAATAAKKIPPAK